jgi:hypothetical protein
MVTALTLCSVCETTQTLQDDFLSVACLLYLQAIVIPPAVATVVCWDDESHFFHVATMMTRMIAAVQR